MTNELLLPVPLVAVMAGFIIAASYHLYEQRKQIKMQRFFKVTKTEKSREDKTFVVTNGNLQMIVDKVHYRGNRFFFVRGESLAATCEVSQSQVNLLVGYFSSCGLEVSEQ